MLLYPIPGLGTRQRLDYKQFFKFNPARRKVLARKSPASPFKAVRLSVLTLLEFSR